MNPIEMKKKSVFLFVFYFIFCFKTLFVSLSLDQNILLITSNVLNVFILMFCVLSFFYLERKLLLIFFFLILLFFLNFIIYGVNYIFGLIVALSLVSLSSRLYWKDLISIIYYATLLSVVLIVFFLPFSDKFLIFDDRTGVRYTFGFYNPNTLAQFLVSLYCVVSLFVFEKVKVRILRIFYLSTVFLLLFSVCYCTGSRTGMALLVMLFSGFLFSALFNNKYLQTRSVFFLFSSLLILIVLFQMISPMYLNDSMILLNMNDFLSGRIWFSKILTDNLPAPLFFHGVNIGGYLPIDFFFVGYFYQLGYILGGIGVVVFLVKIKNKKMNLSMWVCLYAMLLTTMTETYYLIPIYNITLFFTTLYTNNGKLIN